MLKKTKHIFTPVDLPKKDEHLFFIENDGVSILDCLAEIRKRESIEDLSIHSFRIGVKDLKMLEEFNFGFPIKLTLSDSITRMVLSVYNYLENNSNFETTYVHTHEKKCFVKTTDNYYFIFSSGNFNPDGKIEQLSFMNSKTVYEKCLNVKKDMG